MSEASDQLAADGFKFRLKINQHALDEELMSQADIFQSCGESCSLAASIRDQKKNDLKTADAQAFLAIRQKMLDAGEKFTEEVLKARVQVSQRHKIAFDELQAAELKVSQWENLKTAWQDRGWFLRTLCGLHMASYNTQSSVSGGEDSRKEADAHTARSAIADRLKRRGNDNS